MRLAHNLRELVCSGILFRNRHPYVGAAATKSIILGLIILATASLFVPIRIWHPGWTIAFLALTAMTFSLFGFIIGL